LTLPAAALVAAAFHAGLEGIGTSGAGPIVMAGVGVLMTVGLFIAAQRNPVTPQDV